MNNKESKNIKSFFKDKNIFIQALIISLVVFLLLFIVEFGSAKLFGVMPIANEVPGGECVSYIGIGCEMVYLYPLTNSNDKTEIVTTPRMPKVTILPTQGIILYAGFYIVTLIVLTVIWFVRRKNGGVKNVGEYSGVETPEGETPEYTPKTLSEYIKDYKSTYINKAIWVRLTAFLGLAVYVIGGFLPFCIGKSKKYMTKTYFAYIDQPATLLLIFLAAAVLITVLSRFPYAGIIPTIALLIMAISEYKGSLPLRFPEKYDSGCGFAVMTVGLVLSIISFIFIFIMRRRSND